VNQDFIAQSFSHSEQNHERETLSRFVAIRGVFPRSESDYSSMACWKLLLYILWPRADPAACLDGKLNLYQRLLKPPLRGLATPSSPPKPHPNLKPSLPGQCSLLATFLASPWRLEGSSGVKLSHSRSTKRNRKGFLKIVIFTFFYDSLSLRKYFLQVLQFDLIKLLAEIYE